MSDKMKYIVKCLSQGTHKKYETFVINQIYSRLNNPQLEIATQQRIVTKNDGVKFIDLYFPQLKIGIEVDEPYHDDKEQAKRDRKREKNIKNAVLDSTIVETNKKIHFERISISKCGDLEGHPLYISKKYKSELLNFGLDNNLKMFRDSKKCEIIIVEDKNIGMNLNNFLDFSNLNIL